MVVSSVKIKVTHVGLGHRKEELQEKEHRGFARL